MLSCKDQQCHRTSIRSVIVCKITDAHYVVSNGVMFTMSETLYLPDTNPSTLCLKPIPTLFFKTYPLPTSLINLKT